MRIDLHAGGKVMSAAGTLFGNQFLRLVQLGDYHLEANLDGVMLLFNHRDVPGLIGFIGTIVGQHQVDIARMTVGRHQPGGAGIAVLNLDSPPSEEALHEVRTYPQISNGEFQEPRQGSASLPFRRGVERVLPSRTSAVAKKLDTALQGQPGGVDILARRDQARQEQLIG
jgi:D-3-phosphoglycerate dehydrogenase